MKDYLNLEGLSYFLDKLLAKLVSNDDVITNAEIDEICGGIVTAELPQSDIDELMTNIV